MALNIHAELSFLPILRQPASESDLTSVFA